MAAKVVEFHDGAAEDIKNAVAWYGERSSKAAGDFIHEVEQAVRAIGEAPERWPKGKNNTRRFILWRFPFTIIYSEGERVITIWAVAHGSRRPEYWHHRI
jgi:plasmid stabilization system protein ParE